MRWFEQQRIAWIKESVEIFGFLNREHVTKKFGVTAQIASSDLKKFQKMYPGIIKYDVSRKRYVLVNGKPDPD